MQYHNRALFFEEFYKEVPQATYENVDFWYNLSPRCKAEHTAACNHAILDDQFLLFCNVTTFVGAPKSIENRAGHDAIRTMQSVQCNPHDAIRTMQSTRYNPHDANDVIRAIQSAQCNPKANPRICTTATTPRWLRWKGYGNHDKHKGHDGHDSHGVTTATSVTTVTRATRATRPRLP